jgi:hypothetical protein
VEDEEPFLDVLLEILQIVANVTSGCVLLLALAVYFRGVRHETKFMQVLHHDFEVALGRHLRGRGKQRGRTKR